MLQGIALVNKLDSEKRGGSIERDGLLYAGRVSEVGGEDSDDLRGVGSAANRLGDDPEGEIRWYRIEL